MLIAQAFIYRYRNRKFYELVFNNWFFFQANLNFSVKTFSEIMAEKRAAKFAQEKAMEEQSKKPYSPIRFDESGDDKLVSNEVESTIQKSRTKTNTIWSKRTYNDKNSKTTIKPVVFDLDKTDSATDSKKAKLDNTESGPSQKKSWKSKPIVFDAKEGDAQNVPTQSNSTSAPTMSGSSLTQQKTSVVKPVITKRKSAEGPDSSEPGQCYFIVYI